MAAKGEDQLPKTTDIISISLAWVLIISLILKAGWSLYSTSPIERVEKGALICAYQLWEIDMRLHDNNIRQDKVKSMSNRGLASIEMQKIGAIGSDLWMRPYHYHLLEKSDGHREVVVWSLGPDGLNNSQQSVPHFNGDDLGAVLKISSM